MESPEPPHDGPPADPDGWTDDQWIEWLKKTDADAAADAEGADRPATPLGRITHSAGGSALGQAMLGMAAALYGREEPAVVIMAEGNSQPDEDKEFSVHLDPEHPERSVIVFRDQSPDPGEPPTGGAGEATA